MENLVILENSANFNPRDIDEIQLSIGWTEQKYIDAAPLWSRYDVFRNCDYFATAKIGEKTVGILEAFADRDNFATSYLSIIMVHKDYQKKGVGRALMNAFNKKFAHTTTWAITPITQSRDGVAFLEKFGFNETPNFTTCWRKRGVDPLSYEITKKPKKELPQGLVILENSANFNPRDIDEIQLSIGWTEQKYIDAAPLWSHYDMFRNFDYFATAKIGEKTVGVLDAFSDRDNAFTSRLYGIMVHKEYQRKGIGTALMDAFNKKFAHTTTWAITPIGKNKDGVPFLEKFGFNQNTENFTVCWRKRK